MDQPVRPSARVRRTAPPTIGPEGSGADIAVKRGANIDGLSDSVRSIFPHIVEVWRRLGAPPPVITSGNDGRHRRGSRHCSDEAVDLRCNNVADRLAQRLADALQAAVGPDYDVIFERFPRHPANDHIHVEYDPKPRLASGEKKRAATLPILNHSENSHGTRSRPALSERPRHDPAGTPSSGEGAEESAASTVVGHPGEGGARK